MRSARKRELPVSGRKIFFLHVMKTAGTTLRRHIRANVSPEHVYPNASKDAPLVRANTSIRYLTGLPAERLDQLQVIAGHFPYVAIEMLGIDATAITVLRHPVDRTISYLRGAKRNRPQCHDRSLEEIYEDPSLFTAFIANHQSKLFALTSEDAPHSYMKALSMDRGRLEHAMATLGKVDVVGLQEHFDEFGVELERRLGWRIDERRRLHVSRDEPEVADSFRRRIAEDNAFDMEFYEFAVELYEGRNGVRR